MLQFLDCIGERLIPLDNRSFETVFDVIVDERRLGVANCAFDRLSPLGDVDACASLFDHDG
ncbi:hypothetical protein A9R05_39755 (plasmid) [Burkholderia sp. KK1]|nr:hypothetical protein A9R05_39755 [Burkholderia sp. KK1]